MEFLIGIQGEDFVLTAADRCANHSIVRMKDDVNKHHPLAKNLLMSVTGEPGDTTNFTEYIAKNIQLYRMRNGYDLTPISGAAFVRKNLADFLRSRTPFFVNALLSGCNEKDGPVLYHLDYLGAMARAPFASHGYGSFFSLGVLDRHWKPGMNREEVKELMKKCFTQVQKRFIINMPNFQLQIVDKDGIHDAGIWPPPAEQDAVVGME